MTINKKHIPSKQSHFKSNSCRKSEHNTPNWGEDTHNKTQIKNRSSSMLISYKPNFGLLFYATTILKRIKIATKYNTAFFSVAETQ